VIILYFVLLVMHAQCDILPLFNSLMQFLYYLI